MEETHSDWLANQLSRYDPAGFMRIVDGGPSVGYFVQSAKQCPNGTTVLQVPWVDVFDREKALLMLAQCCSFTSPDEAETFACAAALQDSVTAAAVTPLHNSPYWTRIATLVEQIDQFCQARKILDETLYSLALIFMLNRCPSTSKNGFLYRQWKTFRWIDDVIRSCGDMSLPLLLFPDARVEQPLSEYMKADPGDDVCADEGLFLAKYLCEDSLVEEVMGDRKRLVEQAAALRQFLVEELSLRTPVTENGDDPLHVRSLLTFVGWIRSRWVCHERDLSPTTAATAVNPERVVVTDAQSILNTTLQVLHAVQRSMPPTPSNSNPIKKAKCKKQQQSAATVSHRRVVEYCIVPIVEKLNHSPSSTMCPIVDWGHSIILRCDTTTTATHGNNSSASTSALAAGSEMAIYYGSLSNRHLLTRYGFLGDPCIPALGYNDSDTWTIALDGVQLRRSLDRATTTTTTVKAALWMPIDARDQLLDQWEIDTSSLWNSYRVHTISWLLQKNNDSLCNITSPEQAVQGNNATANSTEKSLKIPLEVLFSAAVLAGTPLLMIQKQQPGTLGRRRQNPTMEPSSQEVSSTCGKFYDAEADVDETDGQWQFDSERMLRAFLLEETCVPSSANVSKSAGLGMNEFWEAACDVLRSLFAVSYHQAKGCMEYASRKCDNGGAVFWAERYAAQRLAVAERLMEETEALRRAGPSAYWKL